MYLFYIRTRRVPRSKHSPHQLYETNLLMFCQVKVYTEHLTQCELHVEFLNVKTGGTVNKYYDFKG
jgi:hypothetical protein